jgi:hypothetical protein
LKEKAKELESNGKIMGVQGEANTVMEQNEVSDDEEIDAAS